MPVCIYHFLNLKFCAKVAKLPKEKGYFCAKLDEMLKIGVLGTQNFGRKQIAAIKAADHLLLTGLYNPKDDSNAMGQPENSEMSVFKSFDRFCERVDAIYITNPETVQFDLLVQLLKKSKHLFFERAITFSPQQSSRLLETASEARVRIQFGHLCQFNPAYVAVKSFLDQPALIIVHSWTTFDEGKSKEVVDILIDDIVMAMQTVRSEIKRIHATGVSVISSSPDVIQAKIVFINGTVVSLTGSRISTNKIHQTEFFGKNSYVKVDFLKNQSSKLSTNSENLNNTNQFEEIISEPASAINSELDNFYNSIVHNHESKVSVYTSFKAIQIAGQILDKISDSSNLG